MVGADSLASNAVWTPWPEPIFKRSGELCMAVPMTATQQFFKLVPGTQFIDDFSEPTEPFATRNPWVPYFFNVGDASSFSFTVTNGAFRIRTLTGPVDGRVVIAPPGPLTVFRDLTVSVDILSFAATATEARPLFSICARAWIDDPFPGNSNAYLGGFRVNPARMQIWTGSAPVAGPSFTYDPAAAYRLQLSAVGVDLTLRLVNLATGQILEQRLTDATFSQGNVMLWVEAAPGGSYDLTVDNFFVSGTKP